MRNIAIGKSGIHKIFIDLKILLRTRLLIQANSGGGKSWLLRLIAERVFGKIQTIIIDPEGEFSTLREKFGYVLVGKGGDTPADVRSAAMVAHKLLELNASAVCDLYDLSSDQRRDRFGKFITENNRHYWVQLFLEALINAPKKLWHPLLVIVDEAHVFCPEGKSGESVAAGAMIDLATRGRKRGFCSVFATQRLGKFRKDAAAECTNIMIGQTFIDIDRERAAEALGIPKVEKENFFEQMKIMEPGNFWALGRAISKTRILVSVDTVKTTHPDLESDNQNFDPPPPPKEIRKFLPRLADLPQLAEAKAKTEKELRAEIAQLKRERDVAKKFVPARVEAQKVIEKVPIITNGELKKLETAFNRFDKIVEKYRKTGAEISEQFNTFGQTLGGAVSGLSTLLQKAVAPPAGVRILPKPLVATKPSAKSDFKFANATTVHKFDRAMIKPANPDRAEMGDKPRVGIKRMVQVLAQFPDGRTDTQLRTLAFIPKPKTYETYKSEMMRRGFSEYRDGRNFITEAGMSFLGDDIPERPKSTEELLGLWCSLFRAGIGEILRRIVSEYPDWVDLAEFVGDKLTEKTVITYASELKSNDLAEVSGSKIKASDVFFE